MYNNPIFILIKLIAGLILNSQKPQQYLMQREKFYVVDQQIEVLI